MLNNIIFLGQKKLFYESSDKELTNLDGTLKAPKTLLKLLGKGRLETLGFPRDAIDRAPKSRQNSSEETEMEEILDKISDPGEIKKNLGGNELAKEADKIAKVVKTAIKDGHTLTLGKYLREIMSLDKSVRDIRGVLKTATAKYVMTKNHLDREYEKQKELISGESDEK